MELTEPDFQRTLEALRPRIGQYCFALALIRAAARRVGRFPSGLYRVLRRLSRREPRKPYFVGTTEDGTRFLGDFRDSFSVAWATVPGWDRGVVRFLVQQALMSEQPFIDAGANMGAIAATVARSLSGRQQVFAFEPSREVAMQAAATFALNELSNVRLFPIALSDRDGETSFFQVPGRSATASLHATEHLKPHRAMRQTRVPCRTLDSLLRSGTFTGAGLIKIDVEGHELSVLRGARTVIDQFSPGIFCEHNPNTMVTAPWTSRDLSEYFEEIGGYGMRVLHSDGSWSTFPPTQNGNGLNVYCEPASDRSASLLGTA